MTEPAQDYVEYEERTHLPAIREVAAPATLFGTDDPVAFMERAAKQASVLQQAVHDAGYTTEIQGQTTVRVEGWAMLGAMLGVFPVVAWTRPLKDPDGWEARVEARTRAGELVGAAEAMCTRAEEQWSLNPKGRNGRQLRPRDDFALRAMAQTRATRAALRVPLGFVMGLAGFVTDAASDDSYESAARPRGARSGRGAAQAASRSGNGPTKEHLSQQLGMLLQQLTDTRPEPPEIEDKDGVTVQVDDWRDYARLYCDKWFDCTDSTKLRKEDLQGLNEHLANLLAGFS